MVVMYTMYTSEEKYTTKWEIEKFLLICRINLCWKRVIAGLAYASSAPALQSYLVSFAGEPGAPASPQPAQRFQGVTPDRRIPGMARAYWDPRLLFCRSTAVASQYVGPQDKRVAGILRQQRQNPAYQYVQELPLHAQR
jgi:hypothetical protein